MKSYVFQVELAQEDDGRWSTWIDVLSGCAAWGYTKEEALRASIGISNRILPHCLVAAAMVRPEVRVYK